MPIAPNIKMPARIFMRTGIYYPLHFSQDVIGKLPFALQSDVHDQKRDRDEKIGKTRKEDTGIPLDAAVSVFALFVFRVRFVLIL